MHKNNNILKLSVKGGVLAISLVLAICYPHILVKSFTYDFSLFKVYHVLWLLAVLILIKRFIPRMNPKINLGKIYGRNYVQAGEDSSAKQQRLADYIKKMNFGAMRSAIYWTLLVLDIGFWWVAGLLDPMWLIIIVIFFIFMDQFCITVWCPFKTIIQNKCCNTCRINNWGYLMAFSPLIFIPSFWTYSILFLSVIIIIQWEYLYYKHPERFYELYNAKLMCKNCVNRCKKIRD
ncbi:MAG: hypothetical protein NT010_00585 [Proteobacteria bacterium]|nr:hypothetical protein [Pseudomonadota bacterium]